MDLRKDPKEQAGIKRASYYGAFLADKNNLYYDVLKLVAIKTEVMLSLTVLRSDME
jgi:hypothetical protein